MNMDGKSSVTTQQVLAHLMRMDPQQRNAFIAQNPQLRSFLMQYEQQRRSQLQKMQQQQKQQQQQQQQHLEGQNQAQIPFNQAQQGQPLISQQIPQEQILQQIPQQVSQPSHIPQQSQLSQVLPQLSQQQMQQQQFPLAAHANDLEALPKDKIPKKPLQKKGMKKKALTGVHVPGTTLHEPHVIEQKTNEPDHILDKSIDFGNFKNIEFSNQNSSEILTNPHEWSEDLKSKSLEPDLDLQLYENIISKDLEYIKYSTSILNTIKEGENRINDKVGINGKIFNRILKDLKFYQQVKTARMNSMKLTPENNGLTSRMWGDGYSGYGNGFTDGKIQFIFPNDSKIKIDDERNEINEKIYEEGDYVPIRLEFDIDRDGFKLNDTFVWNTKDDDDTLKSFVSELVKDFRIDNNKNIAQIKQKILNNIKEQISDIHPMVINPNIDLRFPINLDITIANNQLIDRFDWDIMNQENDPEEFAKILCEEFSLNNEFQTAISHSIREQCQIYLKSLYMIGYKFDGGTIVSEDLKDFLRTGFDQNNVIMPRYLLSDFTPYVQELSVNSFERIIKEREREAKRKKRGATRVGRRGGFVLPDLSTMPKTFRTPLPNTLFPGSVTITNDDTKPVVEYHDEPIDINPPPEQLVQLRHFEVQQREKMMVMKHEQQQTNEWLQKIRGRRLRGETLGGSVVIGEVDTNDNKNNSNNNDQDEEPEKSLSVSFRFQWR